TVCGDYATSDGNLHGFFLSGGTFTEYDVPGAVFTAVLGINNPADFAGTFIDGSGIQQAFVSVGGTLTLFSVPAAVATLAYDINDSKRLVVGYYIDSAGILHGYFRDANGALHFPIDPSGSVATILFGDNNRNWVVGRYADSSGVTHGLFFVPPNNFFTFDFPGSTFSSINGTERSERRRAAIRALQQAVERFADATATKRFPSSRCASAIQIVRPLESTTETQSQLQPALLHCDPRGL